MGWTISLLILALSFTTTLQQQDSLPSAPMNVHAAVISCTKIRVTWSPVTFNGAQLTTYKVYYQKSGSAETHVDASGTLKTLSGLSSVTTYSISVVAVSGATEGDRSSETHNTTYGSVKPTNLQSHDITNVSVVVSWEIVSPNIGCDGALLGTFRVRHKPVDALRHKRSTAKQSTTTLNNLLPYTNYSLTVTTMDPSGSNSPSDVLLFHTLPGVPSAPVNVMTSTDESEPTQLLITWQQPLQIQGIISHYDVEYMTQGSSLQTVRTIGSVTEISLTNLQPSSLYTIRVRANNYAMLDQNTSDAIPGTYSNQTSVTLLDPLPVPPGPPRGFRVEPNVLYGVKLELTFRWRSPATGDPVVTYSIICDRSGPDGTQLNKLTYVVSSSATNAKVDAEPYTAYDCYVYGTSSVSDGAFSSRVSIAPIAVASSPIRRLTLPSLDYSSVTLTWIGPRDRNDYITSYIIRLKHTTTNDTREFIQLTPLRITIGNLTGNTPYSVDVIAMSVYNNETLLSNESNVKFITNTGPPSHPRNLTLGAVSHAIVRVHWVPPSPTNGDIIHYEVNVMVQSQYNTENGERDYTESHSTETSDLHFDIPLLTPGSIYSVDVTAFTSEGSGPAARLDVTLDEGRDDAIYYFQLKLKPFTDCTKAQDPDIIQQIQTRLLAGLEEKCACVLATDTITDMKTQCNSDDSHLIYVGRIVGTDTLRPLVILDLLEEWSKESSSTVNADSTQLSIDQDCPIYLSSPSDPNCVQKPVVTIITPTTESIVSDTPATEATSDKETNLVPIYTACVVGGFFIGCVLTLLIVVVVFFCRIKNRKKEIEGEAIYAQPSRRNKRIKISTKNSINNPVMQSCPAYSLDQDNSDYALPRKRTGSIDSADLKLYRTESKQRVNQLPGTPDCKQGTPQPPPPPPPTSLPPYDLYDRPKGLYSSPAKQAMSLDGLSSLSNGHPVNRIRHESVYQSPRTPALSVDDLIHGVPKDKFRYSFSPQYGVVAPRRKSHSVDNFLAHSPTTTGSPARVATPKGTYDDPRRPSLKVEVGNGMYDTPRKSYDYTPLTTRPSVADDKDDGDYSFVE